VAYLGLARKWRPQTFDDLVGQAHITRTLSNAIKGGRVGQGYLFTGTRGIGKTSAARIFAKALRCQQATAPGIPCLKCNDCIEISEGRSVDVLEIDGASNNGVDAVREIRENAKYLPSTGKHKIYLIDEVHMLTTQAFNALLKTLEEPPAHVIFMFATTDPQKIPPTVLSRCQRFDFKRVSQKDLGGRIKQICEAEKVSITTDALAILAREAEGSMRDAVSLLDQVLAIGGAEITATSLTGALGLVDKQTILDCVTGILKGRPLDALEAVGKVHLHGFDLKQFGREILRYLRQIMVARLVENGGADHAAYLDLSDVDLADLKGLLKERSLEDLDMLFRLLNHGLEDVARSPIPKMVMDILIIKMASVADLVSLSDVSGGGEAKTAPVARSAAPAPAAKMQAAAPVETAPVAPAAPSAAGSNEWWAKIVEGLKSQKPLVGSLLEHMGFAATREEGGVLIITLSYDKGHAFYKDQLQSKAYVDLLSQLLRNHLGRAARLEYKELPSSKSLEEMTEEKRRAAAEERKKTVLESEALRATQQLLGAKLEKLDVRGEVTT
jgi:DNA polymerase-3 subunit gamma/tau